MISTKMCGILDSKERQVLQVRTQEYIDAIKGKLTWLETTVRIRAAEGRTDFNKEMEDVVCKVLNLVCGYKLVNMNRLKKNHPAIDLGDETHGIAVQVTSTGTGEKVNHTLQMFEKHGLSEQYQQLIIFVIGKDTSGMKVKSGVIEDSVKWSIWDFAALKAQIDRLGADRFEDLKAIYEYLEREYPTPEPGRICTFEPGMYPVYLEHCLNACSPFGMSDISFVMEDALFQEFERFTSYHWLERLTGKLWELDVEDELIRYCMEGIDPGASMKRNAAALEERVGRLPKDRPRESGALEQIKDQLRKPKYRNCMFLSGFYGSGKTRLAAEAARRLWMDRDMDRHPIFLFVSPVHPESLADSLCAAFAPLLGEDFRLEEYLDACAGYTLVIVLDDLQAYFANRVELRELYGLIEDYSRADVKWILLYQKGVAREPYGFYSDGFSSYAHPWDGELKGYQRGAWLQLDDWYRAQDIPQEIMDQELDIPFGELAWKKSVCSTNYYNPLLANVVIEYSRESDASIFSFNNLLYPDFCKTYYELLSGNDESIGKVVEKTAKIFWKAHELRFLLQDSDQPREETTQLLERGLLNREDTRKISYRGTPDLVWYYLLADEWRETHREEGLAALLEERWEDNPKDFSGILSIWTLFGIRPGNVCTEDWKCMFRNDLGNVALDSGYKCDRELRNLLIDIALKYPEKLREHFTLFMELCTLGGLGKSRLRAVIAFCADAGLEEMKENWEFFVYMLRRNYDSMIWKDVLDVLAYLTPLRDKGVRADILCTLGMDIGFSVARKTADGDQMNKFVYESRRICDGPDSNWSDDENFRKTGKRGRFPAGLYDGFCSGLCNAMIGRWGVAGYEWLIKGNWYTFSRMLNENQLRRNKALTFAMAYEYRGERPGSQYAKRYEALVQRLSKEGAEQRVFALYLIVHTSRREEHYRIALNGELRRLAWELIQRRDMQHLLERKDVDSFCDANYGEDYRNLRRKNRQKQSGKADRNGNRKKKYSHQGHKS